MIRNPIDTPIGRAIVSASTVPEREEMTLTMTRPTTSSIMAAVTRTVPTRVDVKLAAERMAKVVPNDVDDNAAPAANAISLVIPVDVNNGMRRKDSAIGTKIPVIAINIDGTNVCLSK